MHINCNVVKDKNKTKLVKAVSK